MKINLFTPNPPVGGSNLIYFTPFRGGANEENQFLSSGIKTDIHNVLFGILEYSVAVNFLLFTILL